MFYLKLIVILFCIISAPAMAQDEMSYTPEPLSITVKNPYAFATLPGSATGAAFMVINNTAEEDDVLIKVKSDISKKTEIHENLIDPDDGTMMMRKIKGITIPAKGSVTLEPTGKHIMFIKLEEPITLGSSFPITLTFEKLGEVPVNIEVVPPGRKIEKKAPSKSDGFDLNDLYDPLGTAQRKKNN